MATVQVAPIAPTAGGSDYKNTTESVLVKTGDGHLLGIWVSSASASPTIKVWNAVSATGLALANTFTPAAATWYPIPLHFSIGCYVTIGGTLDCTLSFH